MSYSEAVAKDRRLVILKLLENSGGFSANHFLLQSAMEDFGHQVSLDRISTDLAWLAEQGLITVGETGNCKIAKLTTRGLDVATGRTSVPGVKRPTPED